MIGRKRVVGRRFIPSLFRDITNRRRVDEVQGTAEEKLQRTFECITDGITVTDLNGIITDANRRTMEIHGVSSKEQLLGRSAFEFIAQHEHERALANMRKTLEVGAVGGIEYTFLRADGSKFPGEISASVLKDAYGSPVGFIAITHDITERKRMEEVLRESEEFSSSLLTNSPNPITVLNPDSSIRYVNQALEKLTGFSFAELIGRKAPYPWWTEETLHKTEKDLRQAIQQGARRLEELFQKKNGERFWVEITSRPVIINREFKYYLSIWLDITERKQADVALIESERRYRELFRNASDAMVISDLKGNIVEANYAVVALTGYPAREMIKFSIYKLFSPETLELAKASHQLLLQREAATQRCELEVVKKDGIRIPVEAVVRLLTKNEQPQGFLAVLRDITRQMRHKAHLRSYIAEIIRVQEEERKRIARELHDETTQSLATLCLNIQAIAKTKDRVLSKDILERLEELCAETNSILDGVRHFSHQLRPDILDRLGLIPALELLTSELKKEKINVQLEVYGRERRLGGEAELTLFRMAQEALSNIRKHSQATEAVVEVQFMSKKVKLSVTDNGRGFKMPDMLGDLVTAGKLGLIGMQERVLLLGGVFSITSQVGQGTKLWAEVSA